MNFFDIHTIFFEVLGYPMSYLEFFGTVAGIVAVWLSARANVWSWPIGIVNVVLSFFLFYQVQLYPDMFLQVFFFITNLLGWWRWLSPKPEEEDRKRELKISSLSKLQLLSTSSIAIVGTIILGLFAQSLHELLPTMFTKPSASPFLDSFITVMSILATYYLIQKKIECWIIWIVVDVVATYLYFVRDIKVYSLLYLIFTILATYGLLGWMKEYRGYKPETSRT